MIMWSVCITNLNREPENTICYAKIKIGQNRKKTQTNLNCSQDGGCLGCEDSVGIILFMASADAL